MSVAVGRSGRLTMALPGRNHLSGGLPPGDTRRWVARRKAEVVAAVDAGTLSLEAACERYGISLEEFGIWQAALQRHGIGGLRVTQIQVMKRSDRDEASGREVASSSADG